MRNRKVKNKKARRRKEEDNRGERERKRQLEGVDLPRKTNFVKDLNG
jgi:hypothetical protein